MAGFNSSESSPVEPLSESYLTQEINGSNATIKWITQEESQCSNVAQKGSGDEEEMDETVFTNDLVSKYSKPTKMLYIPTKR